MLVNALPRTALAVLLVLCGAASFSSTAGAGPALAGSTEGPEVRSSTSVARVLTPAAAAPTPPTTPPPLQRTGTDTDGWARYRLAAGRVPDRLLPGRGFRGEISWLQGRMVRKARIYVPRSAPTTAPLLVSLHGLGASLQKVEAQQRWSTLSMQQGFVLVWGAGHKGSWNAGPCCGAAVRDGVDDLAYLDRLLQVTGALHAVDRRRVHLAGYSNGAMMAYRYACGRPGRISGVLAVAGTHTAPCRPTRATAVLVVHGADDPTVPLAGTRYSASLRSALPPARRAAALWAGTGAGVRSVVVTGFAHGWPTPSNGRYDTTGQGWAFLEAHPKP